MTESLQNPTVSADEPFGEEYDPYRRKDLPDEIGGTSSEYRERVSSFALGHLNNAVSTTGALVAWFLLYTLLLVGPDVDTGSFFSFDRLVSVLVPGVIAALALVILGDVLLAGYRYHRPQEGLFAPRSNEIAMVCVLTVLIAPCLLFSPDAYAAYVLPLIIPLAVFSMCVGTLCAVPILSKGSGKIRAGRNLADRVWAGFILVGGVLVLSITVANIFGYGMSLQAIIS